MSTALSSQQRRIVGVIFGTYAAYYLGRLNLSTAIPAMSQSLALGRAELGLISTLFFWFYTFGQFLFGELGNRINPRLIVAVGLFVVAASNILFSMQIAIIPMMILWSLNGLAQASGWAPMVRLLTERLDPNQRQRISTFFPMSFQLGTAITWFITGFLIIWGGWQMAFWLPGLILFGVLILWLLTDNGLGKPDAQSQTPFDWRTMLQDWRDLNWMLIAAASIGFIHTGIAIWLPTYIHDIQLFHVNLIGAVAGVMALLGILGMWISGLILAKFQDVRRALSVLTGILLIVLLLSVVLPGSGELAGITLAVIISSGLAALFVGSLPMLLAKENRVSSSAGLLTAIFGVGGGLAGVVIGSILAISDWTSVLILWSACALLALLLIQTIQKPNEVSS
jgi:OPA family glycerol-3-phosphate transporter-like MFS transporter